MDFTGPEGVPEDLLMPFIVCKSNGGELDDDAFVVGMELGGLDANLRMCAAMNAFAVPMPRFIHSVGVKQLDLIAMQHGFVVEHEEWDGEGPGEWSWVQFNLATEPEPDDD
jgi:hypothetical protein